MAKKAARKKAAKKKVVRKAARKTKPKASAKKKNAKPKRRTAKTKAAGPKKRKAPAAKTRTAKEKSAALEYPSNIGLLTQHVDFLTYKVEQVRKFYGDVLGFRTEQREPNLNYLYVHTSATSSIGFMPPHPHMTSEQPPPKESTLYFLVEDVDRIFANLVSKGVAFMGPPQEMPWGHRVVMTHDPEGRTVMLGSESKKE
jgi:predicted enzyme related to lactoylglutathione lyase